ncbi:carbohydrate ABC transporter permease [Acuticoccus sp. M5D2P5]|uniref:carbohydrate ABC transporter permease n=1 Tax=Acuticoccus kalidii TaxID=2910977 RepID=UPI001F2057F8|nr:carbohydrate ABC transporter permease [Acuticoccus kalidii]MCF3935849.1 carbohydrate ABC transporter permease [Acuticoccus kalidii]
MTRKPPSVALTNLVIAFVILLWTLIPIYHMVVMALSPTGGTPAGQLIPSDPTLDNFALTLTEEHFLVQHFWQHLYNSAFVALSVAFLTLFISTLASFAISRLKFSLGGAVSGTALLTYLIPASFLAIPMYVTMTNYDLVETRLSLIMVMVTFATPYAIWVFVQHADSIPRELDEAARIDGASPLQLYRLVFLPLMTPAIVAIGTYALLLAWNEYLYAFLLVSQEMNMTLPVSIGYFLLSDEAPWNLLMAVGILYSIPPAIFYYAVRGYMSSGLTAGAVKA